MKTFLKPINAVITRNPKFSGTCFDSFEYFYRLWELDKSWHYVFLYPQLTKEFITQKYNIDKNCFKNFIFSEVYNITYNKILFFDTHCINYKLLKANKIFVISNSEIRYPQNISVYSEYFNEKNYLHKVYYQIQKVFLHKQNTYIVTQDSYNIEVLKILKNLKSYILKDTNSAFQNYSLTNFKPDFFKDFNHLIYIKTPGSFDRHPRIFTECVYQGITCDYINLTQELDPSYFRFCDRFELEKRNILNDAVIAELLN